jgi:hypothetical protein
MDTPLAASLYGAEKWVCLACFEKSSGLAGIASLIDYLNGVLLTRIPAERYEGFLCNIDSALEIASNPNNAHSFRRHFDSSLPDVALPF